ncbi:MAG TPA: hypothetical protein PLX15_02275 [Candidatus Woesearchaeota archaeon]|nr:hypothetical protein [Candidatus Woesearchaeota archaeon]
MVGNKNNLLGIGNICENKGLVIINPFGEMGELDYEKIYDPSSLKDSKIKMLMYPDFEVITSNLELIRESEPLIYLAPSQEKEINFLKSFFDVKTVKFNKDKFIEWIGFPTSDMKEIKRIAKSNNSSMCLFIYLKLFEKYNLLLNPNMFRIMKNNHTKYLFKDIETLEKIYSIDDFKILKTIIENFSEYDLTSEFIHEILFLISSEDSSERKDALFEIAKYPPGKEISLNCKNEIIKEFIEYDGYIVQKDKKYVTNF